MRAVHFLLAGCRPPTQPALEFGVHSISLASQCAVEVLQDYPLP